MYKKISEQLESSIEKLIFASRWLLAPMFVGLALSLGLLVIKFVEALWHNTKHIWHATEAEMILGTLSLVDIVLTGSLLVIVIFSGYENFVSKIDHTGHEDWPSWMGTIDFTALKLKLLSSIVAISAIQLLKQFMALKTTSDRELMWSVGIHLVFVVSSVLLALSDRIAVHGNSHAAEPHDPAAATPPATTAPHTASAQTAMSAHGASAAGPKRK
jgi:uncharacterized protein (TIGR00645 family)